jgi:hypothetical protein
VSLAADAADDEAVDDQQPDAAAHGLALGALGAPRAFADDHPRREALLLGALQATVVEAGAEIWVGEQNVADGSRHDQKDDPRNVAASQSDESGWPRAVS